MSPNIVSRAAAGIRKNMSALAEACSLFRSRAREVARACGEPRARVRRCWWFRDDYLDTAAEPTSSAFFSALLC